MPGVWTKVEKAPHLIYTPIATVRSGNLHTRWLLFYEFGESLDANVVMISILGKIFGRKTTAGSPSTAPQPAGQTALLAVESGPPGYDDETRLAQAKRIFDRYMAKKIDFLYELLPPRKRLVYDLIPLLLHLDAAELLDSSDACSMSPHGIFGYEPSTNTFQSFTEAFPGKSLPRLRPRASFDPSLPIKSLSLIGSLGSVAQTQKSDFDYWICHDSNLFSRDSFRYFQEKLRAIEKWAEALAGAEVHFFPLELDKLRVDDFGAAKGESSGTALGKLLKEEYYRSMTLVAGQAPLWWVMPPGITDEEYYRLGEVISRSQRIDSTTLIDMGNVKNISLGEFYGAAIWQINKTMGSPFKSILKLAILEEYMFDRGSKGLLCSELKQRLLAREEEIALMDPYVLMFDRASAYLVEQGRHEDVDLLRRSLYLKAGIQLTLADHRRTDLSKKKQVMVHLVRKWGWNQRVIDELNNYHNWNFRQSLKFSQESNAFIIRTYKNVSAELNKQKDQVGLHISQRDLTVLGRKLFIHYSRRTNKVDSIKLMIEAPPALNGITLQPHLEKDNQKVWAAYRALLSWETVTKGGGATHLLRISNDLPELLIWLVNNQVYDSNTSINFNVGAGKLKSHCTVPDLHALIRALKAFFPPFRHSELKEEALLDKPKIVRMFMIINLEEPDMSHQIVHSGLCYQNNWGEIFYKGYNNSQDGIKIARDFVRKNFAFDPLGALANFKIFMPDRQFKRVMSSKFDKYFGMKVVI